MADRTGTGDVEAVRVSDPELAFESINVRLFVRQYEAVLNNG